MLNQATGQNKLEDKSVASTTAKGRFSSAGNLSLNNNMLVRGIICSAIQWLVVCYVVWLGLMGWIFGQTHMLVTMSQHTLV